MSIWFVINLYLWHPMSKFPNQICDWSWRDPEKCERNLKFEHMCEKRERESRTRGFSYGHPNCATLGAEKSSFKWNEDQSNRRQSLTFIVLIREFTWNPFIFSHGRKIFLFTFFVISLSMSFFFFFSVWFWYFSSRINSGIFSFIVQNVMVLFFVLILLNFKDILRWHQFVFIGYRDACFLFVDGGILIEINRHLRMIIVISLCRSNIKHQTFEHSIPDYNFY